MKLLLLNFLLNSGNQPLGEMSTSNCAGSNRIYCAGSNRIWW